MTSQSDRSTQDVFDSHLTLRRQGKTEEDIERNYAEDIVVLSGSGINQGLEGIRTTATILEKYMPGGSWEYPVRLVDGDYAYFVHSYYADPDDEHAVVAETEYGVTFPAIVANDDGTVFGEAAGLIASAAIARLRPSTVTPQGMLALGARHAGTFHPTQGTDLLLFLARVTQHCLDRWLAPTS